MTEFDQIIRYVPQNSDTKIDWQALNSTSLSPIFKRMAETMQNPEYHAEGDVLTHTKMVCEALICDPEYLNADENDKIILFLSALLHDIGKTVCTRLENGVLTSPRHSIVGAVMAREFLWHELSLSGTKEKQILRESISNLIRYHSFPPYAISAKDPQKRLITIAANGELATGFNIRKLCTLERADARGRVSKNESDHIERVEYCALAAEEACCLDAPYKFSSDYSKRAYFSGKLSWPGGEIYRDSFGEVILMSGLPGTGKDTWIEKNHPDMPVISLDRIREELRVSPLENQGPVIAEAHGRARAYLRKKTPFIWNATSINAQLRSKQISLFEEYGASVRTVFLETSMEEELRRNKERDREVPERVIMNMLSRLELPERHESETVEWQIT